MEQLKQELKRKCKVIMLPTKKAIDFCIGKNNGELSIMTRGKCGNKVFEVGFKESNCNQVPQHLYLVSKEKIKEGDWCLDKRDNTIFKAAKLMHKYYMPNFSKIEATTDPSLNLPLIPQSFIEKYVEKEGKIDEVNIKLRLLGNYFINPDKESIVETRCSDNTCIISKVQDTFNKEDMEKAFNAGIESQQQSIEGNINEGIISQEGFYFDHWFDSNY